MIKPALLYKDDLLKSFAEYLYTEDYFLYNGYDCGSVLPNIEPKENLYQFAFIDKHNKTIVFLWIVFFRQRESDNWRGFI